ncbi:MAG: nuclear transport factor 2 family protein [Candidatus Rokubacteria bacterium]|nr:nuclear transport factor 2 family protein [Candidatus Rokubacteria bacterium]
MTATLVRQTYGRDAVVRTDAMRDPGVDGARAAVEAFYAGFNGRSLDTLAAVWAPGPLSQLNNPLGGVVRGWEGIAALYARIFDGPARVWVELHDIVEYVAGGMAVFAGRERGEFTRDGRTLALAIRTTRAFQYLGAGVGWRQVHHHGSIDDPAALAAYQDAVRGGR